MDRKEKALNQRQKEFCLHYANCGNASEAARKAGYKGKANVISAQLLANISIQAEIRRLAKVKKKNIASCTEMREMLTEVMRSEEADIKDRMKALELLGKSRGMFLERREITGQSKIVVLPAEKD